MKYGDECLSVLDERFDLSHRQMEPVQELCTLLIDEGNVIGRTQLRDGAGDHASPHLCFLRPALVIGSKIFSIKFK
jgi:hypothetical protein